MHAKTTTFWYLLTFSFRFGVHARMHCNGSDISAIFLDMAELLRLRMQAKSVSFLALIFCYQYKELVLLGQNFSPVPPT